MSDLCRGRGSHDQKVPVLGLMFCYYHLEFLNFFKIRNLAISCCTGSHKLSLGEVFKFTTCQVQPEIKVILISVFFPYIFSDCSITQLEKTRYFPLKERVSQKSQVKQFAEIEHQMSVHDYLSMDSDLQQSHVFRRKPQLCLYKVIQGLYFFYFVTLPFHKTLSLIQWLKLAPCHIHISTHGIGKEDVLR